MKRFTSLLFSLLVFFSALNLTPAAKTTDPCKELYPEGQTLISETTKTLENGDSIVITVSQSSPLSRATDTVSGTKTYSYRNGDNEILWQLSVHGTFSVNTGVSATCTSARASYKINDSAWSCNNSGTSKSGNKATATGEFSKKILFIVVDTENCSVTLSCSASGTLS